MDYIFQLLVFFNPVYNLTGTLVIFVLTLLIAREFGCCRRRSRVGRGSFPPGPWRLPIVGHLPFLVPNPIATFAVYRKKYGDIFSIQLGSYPAVVLNGSNVIRKALTTHLEDFAGRPELYTFKLLENVRGVSGIGFSSYGPSWKALHRISTSTLKMFTSNRHSPVTDIILEEARRLTDDFLEHNGQPFNPFEETSLASGSVMYQLLFGRNANAREDDNFIRMIKTLNDFVEFAGAGNPIDVMPWTRFIFKKRLERFIETTRVSDAIYKEQLEAHTATFDQNHIRDITDALLLASRSINEEDKRLGISTTKVTSVINDFLGAGAETVATTLLWTFLFMAINPRVQARVQSEIRKHIGNSRHPTYDDRKAMPYVEATLFEVHRRATIAPLALPHSTTKDVEFMGYRIPKNTFVFVNLASTCNDESVWEDPGIFRPERFLNDHGLDSSKTDLILSFGAGRRRCLGESFAKLELFLLFVYVMQRCSFRKAPGESYTLNTTFGLTLKPAPFKLIVENRSK